MNQANRRQFLRNLILAGATLYFPACRNDKPKSLPKSPAVDSDTLQRVEEIVEQMEADFKSKNVLFLRSADTQYAELNIAFNRRITRQPKIIALPQNVEGVSEAVRYAKQFKLPVAVKSGGHSFEGFSSNDGGMCINLSLFKNIDWINDNTVRIGSGIKLFEMYDALLPKGKIIPAGSCATVGIAGLALGGGYGLFSRKYGLTCDHVTGLTLVDGNGKIHRVTDENELLWACRGGNNGNFGIVTDFTFRVHPAPTAFTRHLFKAYRLDVNRANNLLKTWFAETAKLPDSCFAAYVLNGKTLTVLLTDADNRRTEIQPVLDKLTAVMDKATIGEPTTNLAKALSRYYGIQEPIYFKNACAGLYKNYDSITACTAQVIETVQANRGLIYQVNTLGGQISNPEFAARSAYPHRAYPYLGELQAYYDKPEQEARLLSAFQHIQETFAANGIDRHYRNYPDINFMNWERAYFGENYERLQVVKRAYDKENIFRYEQSIKT